MGRVSNVAWNDREVAWEKVSQEMEDRGNLAINARAALDAIFHPEEKGKVKMSVKPSFPPRPRD
jgi:hypothetical protein